MLHCIYIKVTAYFIITYFPAITQPTDKILLIIEHCTILISTKCKSTKLDTRANTDTPASPGHIISNTQETRVVTNTLILNAKKDNDWNPDDTESKTSKKVVITYQNISALLEKDGSAVLIFAFRPWRSMEAQKISTGGCRDSEMPPSYVSSEVAKTILLLEHAAGIQRTWNQ